MVSTEEQRDEAIALSTEQENWLYDDGWDMDAATYRKKRAELAEVGGMTLILFFELVVFRRICRNWCRPLSPQYTCCCFLFYRLLQGDRTLQLSVTSGMKRCRWVISAYLTLYSHAWRTETA